MKTIIEMAREAGFVLAGKFTTRIHGYDRDGDYTEELKAFAALVRADERELVLAAAIDGAEHAARKAVADEREACAKMAGWLWQQFQDTKDAHERNTAEPFQPSRFGFDQPTVQQSKRMMDDIRARGQA